MRRMFERGMQGAAFGGLMGGTLATLATGAALMIPGVNLVAAPIAVAVAATTAGVSGVTLGTGIGGTAGAISGAIEDARERKRK